MSNSSEDRVTFKDKYNKCKTWQEKAVLISLYHRLMCLKYPTWNLTDTALHFDVSIGLVSENIRLAKEIDDSKNSKKIMNCKTREEGLKFIDRRRYIRDRNDYILYNEENDD